MAPVAHMNTAVVTVTYSNGKDGAVYTAEACNVTGISNEEITCKSVPGGEQRIRNITIDSTAVELLGEQVHVPTVLFGLTIPKSLDSRQTIAFQASLQ